MLDSNLSIKDELPDKVKRSPADDLGLTEEQLSTLSPEDRSTLFALHAADGGTVPPVDDGIINEMPPSMSGYNVGGIKGLLSRAAYKNFGDETPTAMNQLHKWNDKVDFSLRETAPNDPLTSTEVIATENGKKYRLDPEPRDLSSFISDLPKDALDVGFDMASGAAQGTTSAIGGLLGGSLGGMSTGGIGAVPLAMTGASIGSAVGATGAEALRESIGSLLGLNDGYSAEQMLGNGIVGAVAPTVFGSGATRKMAEPYAKKAIANMLEGNIKPLEKDMVDKILRTQMGLPRKVLGPIASKLGSYASGVSESVINRAKDILPQILQTQENPQLYIDRVNHINESVSNAVGEEFKNIGGKLGDMRKKMTSLGVSIPVSEIIEPIKERMSKLRSSVVKLGNREADVEKLDALQAIIDKHFTSNVKSTVYRQVQDPSVNYPKLIAIPQEVVNKVPIEKVDAESAIQFRDELNSLAKSFGVDTPALAKRTEEGLLKNPNAAANEIQKGGTTVNNDFGREFSAAAKHASDSVKTAANNVSEGFGNEYSSLNDQFYSLKKLSEEFETAKLYSDNGATVDKLVRNAEETFNPFADALIQKATDISGVNIRDEALNLRTLRTFVKPTQDFFGSRGATSTGKMGRAVVSGGAIGAGIGMYNSRNENSSGTSMTLGGLIGGAAGAALSRPNMMFQYIKLGDKIRAIPRNAQKLPVPIGPSTPYLLMKPSENER
jgi:hypothetical protein